MEPDEILYQRNPYSSEAEKSVIGSMLIDPRAVGMVLPVLKETDFYIPANQEIFRAVNTLAFESATIDPVTVLARMKEQGTYTDDVRGYMLQLMDITPTAANVGEYARIVKADSRKREVKELCAGILNDAASSPEELLGRISMGVEEITKDAVSSGLVTASQAVTELIVDSDSFSDGSKSLLSTGFRSLDKAMGGGLVGGMLAIIAGRPGMGKTTLALAIAEEFAKQGPILYVTLEMTRQQIVAKIIARHSGVPAHRLLFGSMTDDECDKVTSVTSDVGRLNLFINKAMGATVDEIAILARSIKGLRAVVVDHLGLIRAKDARHHSRTEQVTEISGALKRLALSLDVPVLALSQLNRGNEGRTNKRPTLADLRDSGSIEQDADVVMLLHRDDYYAKEKPKPWEASLLEVDFAKTRFSIAKKVCLNAFMAKDIIEETE